MAEQNFSAALRMTKPQVIRQYLRSFAFELDARTRAARLRRKPTWTPLHSAMMRAVAPARGGLSAVSEKGFAELPASAPLILEVPPAYQLGMNRLKAVASDEGRLVRSQSQLSQERHEELSAVDRAA
jgi:hypothetical protein